MKWKIFIVASYIVLSSSIIIFIFLLQSRVTHFGPGDDHSLLDITLTGLLIMIANSIFEIVLFHRYFPDNDVPRNKKKWHWFFTVLYTFSLLLLILITGIGTNEEIIRGEFSKSGMQILAFLYFLLILTVFNYICQLSMLQYIRKAFDRKITSIVNGLGSDYQN